MTSDEEGREWAKGSVDTYWFTMGWGAALKQVEEAIRLHGVEGLDTLLGDQQGAIKFWEDETGR